MKVDEKKVKEFGKWIDEKIDWKKITKKDVVGGILDAADNFLIPQSLKYLNDLSEKLPEKYQDNLNHLIDACLKEDPSIALNTIPNLITDIGDIKALDDELETQFVALLIEAVLQLIEFYFKRKF